MSTDNHTAEQVDTGQDSVAVTYAKALLGALATNGQTNDTLAELDSFVADVWGKLPQLTKTLSSRLLGGEEKSSLIQKALTGKASQVFLNFLLVLAKHDRLASLPAIQRAVRKLLDQQSGIVRVNVITADPLDTAQLTTLKQSLQGLFGANPVLHNQIDPSIIGGLVLQVGDQVYDGSLASQLQRVREQMITRSVHEIQSRRDRFSSAERN
jgi:F-type H+-transporting ATPase subunit delta